jgi:hypothetical protein
MDAVPDERTRMTAIGSALTAPAQQLAQGARVDADGDHDGDAQAEAATSRLREAGAGPSTSAVDVHA